MLEEERQSDEVAGPDDIPLPATLTFVLIMGLTYLILWFGVFTILRIRW